MRRIVFRLTIAAALIGAGCTSPPESVQEAAAVSDEVYGALALSITTMGDALRRELLDLDRTSSVLEVRSGQPPLFRDEAARKLVVGALLAKQIEWVGENASTTETVKQVETAAALVRLYRIHYGQIARFLRIDVLDLDDLSDLAKAAKDASGEFASFVKEGDE